MTPSQAKLRQASIEVLARNYPEVTDIAKLQDELFSLSLAASRNAEALCNDTSGDYVDQRPKLRAKLARIQRKHQVTLEAEIAGDPRGYCLKLTLPDGTSNSFDTVHFGFPTEG